MSEREFELYLSVLGGMMKLSSSQRKDLAEELCSHMDERLDDLIAEGLTRDEAIQRALEEFGDAAGLAANFTQIAQLKQRRRIMRWTTGTIAATTCAILALASFWPQNNPAGPLIVSKTEAQSEARVAATGLAALAEEGPLDSSAPRNKIEEKMAQPFPGKIQFFDMPLRDVLDYISEQIEVDILIDNRLHSNPHSDFSQAVSLDFQYGKVTTKTLLTLLFEQGDMAGEAGYLVRDEILYITDISNVENTMTVRVYNCRDLVGMSSPSGAGLDFGGGAGADSYGDLGAGAGFGGGGYGGGEGYGMAPGGGMPGGMGGPGRMRSGSPFPGQYDLVSVVTQTIEPGWWNDEGSEGSARLFDGLLVIKHTSEVHQQVEELLKLIRDAKKLDPWNRNTKTQ
jgi:hypothetical protein